MKIDEFIDELERFFHVAILSMLFVGLSILMFKLFYCMKITEEKNQLNNKNCEKTVESKEIKKIIGIWIL